MNPVALLAALLAAVALSFLLTPGTETAAQEGPSAQVTNVQSEDWPALTTAVTVLDASGRPATGLPPNAFSGSIAGQEIDLVSATPASAPGIGIAVVFTFDTSGSMEGAPLAEAKAAAKGLVAQIGPDDQAAVVQFASQVSVVQGFTGDRAAIERAIDSLQAVGDTALYAGVQGSIQLADTAPLPRRSVILLSDGVDSGGVSGVDEATTLTLADQSDAIIFTIGLGSDINEAYLSQLAQRGRGEYLRAPTPDQLAGVYETAGSILRNQYILSFDASSVDTAAAAGAPLVVSVDMAGQVVSSSAPVTLPTAETPIATTEPTPPPSTVTEESSGGGMPVLAVAGGAGLGLAALAAGAVLFVRRRRTAKVKAVEIEVERFRQHDAKPAMPEIVRAVEPEEAMGWLVLPDGGKKPLGMTPITIGFSADCTVQLEGGGPTSMERVRVWWRDGNFMLHNLSRTGTVGIGGKPVTWVVLEDGDEIEIGGRSVRFVENNEQG